MKRFRFQFIFAFQTQLSWLSFSSDYLFSIEVWDEMRLTQRRGHLHCGRKFGKFRSLPDVALVGNVWQLPSSQSIAKIRRNNPKDTKNCDKFRRRRKMKVFSLWRTFMGLEMKLKDAEMCQRLFRLEICHCVLWWMAFAWQRALSLSLSADLFSIHQADLSRWNFSRSSSASESLAICWA